MSTLTPCRTCGAEVFVDFRGHVSRCRPCGQPADRCACAPVPLWLQLARQRKNGLARDLTRVA